MAKKSKPYLLPLDINRRRAPNNEFRIFMMAPNPPQPNFTMAQKRNQQRIRKRQGLTQVATASADGGAGSGAGGGVTAHRSSLHLAPHPPDPRVPHTPDLPWPAHWGKKTKNQKDHRKRRQKSKEEEEEEEGGEVGRNESPCEIMVVRGREAWQGHLRGPSRSFPIVVSASPQVRKERGGETKTPGFPACPLSLPRSFRFKPA